LLDKAKALFKPLPESVNCEGINQQVWSACARAWPQFEREVRDIADGGQSFGSGEYAPRTFNVQGATAPSGHLLWARLFLLAALEQTPGIARLASTSPRRSLISALTALAGQRSWSIRSLR
jgi:hypothetical protein